MYHEFKIVCLSLIEESDSPDKYHFVTDLPLGDRYFYTGIVDTNNIQNIYGQTDHYSTDGSI